MNFLEKDLEEIIFNTDTEILCKKGICLQGKKFRQLRLGNYGIADIVTFHTEYFWTSDNEYEKYLVINVYELKKDKAGISAFLQALQYCKGIDFYLKQVREKYLNTKYIVNIVGRKIDSKSSYIYLTDFLTGDYNEYGLSLNNYSYSYNVDGIKFRLENGYRLINSGFENEN